MLTTLSSKETKANDMLNIENFWNHVYSAAEGRFAAMTAGWNIYISICNNKKPQDMTSKLTNFSRHSGEHCSDRLLDFLGR